MLADNWECSDAGSEAQLSEVRLLQTSLQLEKVNRSPGASAKPLEEEISQLLHPHNKSNSTRHALQRPSIAVLLSEQMFTTAWTVGSSLLSSERSEDADIRQIRQWLETPPSKEVGRVIGISASILLLLFCYWITTLKEVPPMLREKGDEEVKDLPPISPEELKKHSHQGDLWVCVDGVVANLTEFAASHPGGVDLLLQHGGGDASEPFHDVGHSGFAVDQLKKHAVGMLALPQSPQAGAGKGAIAVERDSVTSRIFTKEDPYNVHKVLGFTVLSLYLYRIFVWICQLQGPDSDWAGFRPDLWALASVLTVEGLQLSSFIFHVPKNRPLSGPMIWQEWRAHNLIFVSRLVFVFLCAWTINRYNAMAGWPLWAMMTLCQLSVFVQMRLADLATAWLRDDTHETLVSTMPYWEHCPKWVESMFRTWYSASQIYTTVTIILAGPGMDLYFVMILPYQLYSVLMTFVRKGVISSRTCHVTYFWSLWQSWICGFMLRSPRFFIQMQFLQILIYCTRVYGLNKYVLWIGLCIPVQFSLYATWPTRSGSEMLDYPTTSVMVLMWFCLGLGLKFFTSTPLFDSRHARYVEARPKRLILRSREKVSSSLYHLKFDFPWFFRWQGYSSGLQPGQHVKLLCKNASQGLKLWNGHSNLEVSVEHLSRSYTPINSSKEPTVDFIVKYYPSDASTGFGDGGRASKLLCEELKEGDEVWLSGPHGGKVYRGNGNFLVDGRVIKAETICALAGGSGITPVLSLLRQCREECRASYTNPAAQQDLVKEFSVVHSMRSMDEKLDAVWYTPVTELGLAPRCTVTSLATKDDTSLKRQTSTPREGMLTRYGKLSRAVLEEIFPSPSENVVVVICGPKGFVDEACLPLLREMKYTNVITMW